MCITRSLRTWRLGVALCLVLVATGCGGGDGGLPPANAFSGSWTGTWSEAGGRSGTLSWQIEDIFRVLTGTITVSGTGETANVDGICDIRGYVSATVRLSVGAEHWHGTLFTTPTGASGTLTCSRSGRPDTLVTVTLTR